MFYIIQFILGIFSYRLPIMYQIGLFILGFSFFVFLKKERRLVYLFLLLLAFILGYFRCSISLNHKGSLDEKVYKTSEYVGTIQKMKQAGSGVNLVVRLEKERERITLYSDLLDLKEGYRVFIKGYIYKPSAATNKGQFDELGYLYTQKIYYKFYGEIQKVEENRGLKVRLYDFKSQLRSIYDQLFEDPDSGILKTMILGDSQSLDQDVRDLYADTGVVHILAISGLHVGILSSFIFSIFQKAGLNEKISALLSICIVLFYTILTGASISTVRACIMVSIFLFAKVVERDYNVKNSLAIAGVVLLLYEPLYLWNIGFLLSFTAVIAIVSSPNLSYKIRNKRLKSWVGNMTVNLSSFMFTFPIIAYNFYMVPLGSIVANLFVLPFVKVLVISSMSLMLIYKIHFGLATVLAYIPKMILMYYETILRWITSLKISKLFTGRIGILAILASYCSILVLYYHIQNKEEVKKDRKKVVWIALSVMMITILILLNLFLKPLLTVTFLDVKHGSASFMMDRQKRTVLVDGGGLRTQAKRNTGANILFPYLQLSGARRVDVAIVTHPDQDHIQGIIEILDLIETGAVILPIGKINEKPLAQILIKKCEQKGIPVYYFKKGDQFTVGEMKFTCVYPPQNIDHFELNVNNYSLVFRMEYRDKKIIFTGDIEKEGEKLLAERMEEQEEVYLLTIPHHGSTTSSTENLFSVFRPRLSILSGDAKNEQEWRNRVSKIYERYGVDVKSTSRFGMISLEIWR